MLTDEQVAAIKARVAATTPWPWRTAGGNQIIQPEIHQDVAALLVDRAELLADRDFYANELKSAADKWADLTALAKELAEHLHRECPGDIGASARNKGVLAKARAAGLLEGQ